MQFLRVEIIGFADESFPGFCGAILNIRGPVLCHVMR